MAGRLDGMIVFICLVIAVSVIQDAKSGVRVYGIPIPDLAQPSLMVFAGQNETESDRKEDQERLQTTYAARG